MHDLRMLASVKAAALSAFLVAVVLFGLDATAAMPWAVPTGTLVGFASTYLFWWPHRRHE